MSDDKVVPIGRRPRDTAPPAPDRRVHPSTRRATAAARDLAVAQNTPVREQYDQAARQQREERLLAEGTPVPARITIALGDRGGPQVDRDVGTFEGNPAGDVDAWEDPDDPRLPTGEQVRLLAQLTGYGITWFYKPYVPRPTRMTVCWRDKRGCETVEDDGVPVPPGRQPGQHTLPGMPPAGDPPAKPSSSKTRSSSSRTPPPRKNTPPPAVQPRLPSRMPDELRAPLMAKLAEVQGRSRPAKPARTSNP